MRSKEAVRQRWERLARYYRGSDSGRLERLAIGDSRAWICAQATGRTLEIAVGAGGNLAWYPAEVKLTGVDLTPAMLALAHRLQ
jgi:hypothetical protein